MMAMERFSLLLVALLWLLMRGALRCSPEYGLRCSLPPHPPRSRIRRRRRSSEDEVSPHRQPGNTGNLAVTGTNFAS
jgi:hypothetical protein